MPNASAQGQAAFHSNPLQDDSDLELPSAASAGSDSPHGSERLDAIPEDAPGIKQFAPGRFDFEALTLHSLSRSESQNSGLSVEGMETREEFLKRREDVADRLTTAERLIEQYSFVPMADDDKGKSLQAAASEALLDLIPMMAERGVPSEIRKRVAALRMHLKEKTWDRPHVADYSSRDARFSDRRRGAVTPSGSRTPHPKSPSGSGAASGSSTPVRKKAGDAKSSASINAVRLASPVESFKADFQAKSVEYRAFVLFSKRWFATENLVFLSNCEKFLQCDARPDSRDRFESSRIANLLMKQSRAIKLVSPDAQGSRESKFGFEIGEAAPGQDEDIEVNVSDQDRKALAASFKVDPRSEEMRTAVAAVMDSFFTLVGQDRWSAFLRDPEFSKYMAQALQDPRAGLTFG
jgi:hypothetical protein